MAALGAIGDRGGLPAILRRHPDKPAVRRRAVLALAPFEGPEVDAALERALARPGLAGPPGRRGPERALRVAPAPDRVLHEQVLDRVELLEALAGAEHDAFERARRPGWTGRLVSCCSRSSSPRSMPPPPTRWIPWVIRSWASSGGDAPETLDDGVHDGPDLLLDRLPDLLGREDHRLRAARS